MSKNDRLILGMLLGGICMFIVMTIISLSAAGKNQEKASKSSIPTTLDALTAAASFHRLIFEDEKIRVTELVIPPGQETPPHAHPLRSTSWVTRGTPIVRTHYSGDKLQKLKISTIDTLTLRADQINKAIPEEAGILHKLKNVGAEEFREYRIEYKE